MRNSIQSFNMILVIIMTSFNFIVAQDNLVFDLDYEVNRVYPCLSISPDQLKEAVTLIDLNPYYKPNWVESFISVEISTLNNGKLNKIVSKDNVITDAQLSSMQTADIDSDIKVIVHYMPKNNLNQKEQKVEDFSFKIDPEHEATYSQGKDGLMRYLAKNALDKIDNNSFEQYKLTAVKFTINEEGQVVDAQVVEKSQSETVDKLLLDAICNMPKWTPASYTNGTKVKQEFVFTIGDHTSCVIYLLNIRRC